MKLDVLDVDSCINIYIIDLRMSFLLLLFLFLVSDGRLEHEDKPSVKSPGKDRS